MFRYLNAEHELTAKIDVKLVSPRFNVETKTGLEKSLISIFRYDPEIRYRINFDVLNRCKTFTFDPETPVPRFDVETNAAQATKLPKFVFKLIVFINTVRNGCTNIKQYKCSKYLWTHEHV